MTGHPRTAARVPAVVETVSAYFDRAVAALTDWTPELRRELAQAQHTNMLTRGHLDMLVHDYALRVLDNRDLGAYGAGFIAAVDVLADVRGHLSWWQGPAREQLALAPQNLGKEHIDYTALEWYRVPAATGREHIAGPHVDYLCSDEYTVTVAAPVHVGTQFLGVAGLDLLIDSIEAALLPRLAEYVDGGAIAEVTLVNQRGRILISTDPHRETGAALRDTGPGWRHSECPGHPITIAVRSA